jgi:hypothetical protein
MACCSARWHRARQSTPRRSPAGLRPPAIG